VVSRRDGTWWHRSADDEHWFTDGRKARDVLLAWSVVETAHGPVVPNEAWRVPREVPRYLPGWVDSLRSRIELQPYELTERDGNVLRMRFGLRGRRPRTHADIGFVCGVTRERIRQIERVALEALNLWPPLVEE